MKYYNYDVVLQEVPNEVSLSFSIAGCPLKCEGCHWKHYSNREQKILDMITYGSILDKYSDCVSCVLFYGGEWHNEKLMTMLKEAKRRGLKTCLYTGHMTIDSKIKDNLDYLKIGPYIAKLGGLNSTKTNQRLINLNTGEILNKYFVK